MEGGSLDKASSAGHPLFYDCSQPECYHHHHHHQSHLLLPPLARPPRTCKPWRYSESESEQPSTTRHAWCGMRGAASPCRSMCMGKAAYI